MPNQALPRSPFFSIIVLAAPLILANITVPLLGLIDTAILGHMDETYYLAGASIASLIFTQIIWVCGFLKMSVTGLSAQSKHASSQQQLKVIVQALSVGLSIGLALILLQLPLLKLGLWFASTDVNVNQSTSDYFLVRIWSAPASLMNLALIGWLIGQQQTKLVMGLQVLVNLLNIAFSLCFVYVLDLGIKGVALGTVLADYSLLIISLVLVFRPLVIKEFKAIWLSILEMRKVLQLNSNILLRNLALQFTLAFITFKGAQYGPLSAASNAILMQFFALIALGLDGIANAVEALVGEAKGQKDVQSIKTSVNHGLIWSSLIALIYALIFGLFAAQIVSLLTNQDALIENLNNYYFVIISLPLIAHWCFLFDGVFVGLTRGAEMRDTMIMSVVFGFIPAFLIFQEHENHALWYGLLMFLACRGIFLGLAFYRLASKDGFKLLN